jgi:hypothetical protein
VTAEPCDRVPEMSERIIQIGGPAFFGKIAQD